MHARSAVDKVGVAVRVEVRTQNGAGAAEAEKYKARSRGVVCARRRDVTFDDEPVARSNGVGERVVESVSKTKIFDAESCPLSTPSDSDSLAAVEKKGGSKFSVASTAPEELQFLIQHTDVAVKTRAAGAWDFLATTGETDDRNSSFCDYVEDKFERQWDKVRGHPVSSDGEPDPDFDYYPPQIWHGIITMVARPKHGRVPRFAYVRRETRLTTTPCTCLKRRTS
jgi:hypothetical protein